MKETWMTEIREQKLRNILNELSDTWRRDSAVSWTEIYQTGEKLLERKTKENISGLWRQKPKIITATLDDAMGQGLKMIHLFSRIAGMDIMPLGLMQTKDAIIEACQKHRPAFLGMTILQFDSEELLNGIIERIPKEIQVLVGGPVFNAMDRKALSKKRYIVLNTVSAYLDFLLNRQPSSTKS
jgi:methylmalonyl-CoA mutase cobalamin-binding subunit